MRRLKNVSRTCVKHTPRLSRVGDYTLENPFIRSTEWFMGGLSTTSRSLPTHPSTDYVPAAGFSERSCDCLCELSVSLSLSVSSGYVLPLDYHDAIINTSHSQWWCARFLYGARRDDDRICTEFCVLRSRWTLPRVFFLAWARFLFNVVSLNAMKIRVVDNKLDRSTETNDGGCKIGWTARIHKLIFFQSNIERGNALKLMTSYFPSSSFCAETIEIYVAALW